MLVPKVLDDDLFMDNITFLGGELGWLHANIHNTIYNISISEICNIHPQNLT